MGEYFDLPDRYPDLFEQLNNKQKRGITQTLASAWLDGYEHSREEIARLIDLELGRISWEEYRKQILEHALALNEQRSQEAKSSTKPNEIEQYQPVYYLPERGLPWKTAPPILRRSTSTS